MAKEKLTVKSGVLIKCKGGDDVYLPETVTVIGERAFTCNVTITRAVLSQSVTSIEKEAFSYCDNLQRVVFTQSLKSIGQGAFLTCENLRSAEIPDGVQKIEDSLFCGCSRFDEISLHDGIVSIGNLAFSGTDLTSFSAPKKLVSIGEGAFKSCKDLSHLRLNEGLQSIGKEAFYGCDIHRVNLPQSLKFIGDGAFAECDVNADMKDAILKLNPKAFDRQPISHDREAVVGQSVGKAQVKADSRIQTATALKQILKKGNAEDWAEFIFGEEDRAAAGSKANASALKSTTAEGTVDAVRLSAAQKRRDEVIKEAENIKKSANLNQTYEFDIVEDRLLDASDALGDMIVPAGVKVIGTYAFAYVEDVTSVALPSSLEKIEADAFIECTGLKEMFIPDSVTEIESEAFYGCENLASVRLPEGLTSVGEECFRDCMFLENINIPASLTNVGDGAFRGCNLIEGALREEILKINPQAFEMRAAMNTSATPKF